MYFIIGMLKNSERNLTNDVLWIVLSWVTKNGDLLINETNNTQLVASLVTRIYISVGAESCRGSRGWVINMMTHQKYGIRLSLNIWSPYLLNYVVRKLSMTKHQKVDEKLVTIGQNWSKSVKHWSKLGKNSKKGVNSCKKLSKKSNKTWYRTFDPSRESENVNHWWVIENSFELFALTVNTYHALSVIKLSRVGNGADKNGSSLSLLDT